MENKKLKRQNVYKVIMLLVLTATITFMLTTILMYNKFQTAYQTSYIKDESNISSSEISLVKTLEGFKAMLEQKYIGEVDEEKLVEGAIKGYIEGLGDPYTEYLTKEEMEEFTEETNSEYVGIGVYVANNTADNTILVVGVMNSSPALEAGMQPGDIIEKIDGE